MRVLAVKSGTRQARDVRGHAGVLGWSSRSNAPSGWLPLRCLRAIRPIGLRLNFRCSTQDRKRQIQQAMTGKILFCISPPALSVESLSAHAAARDHRNTVCPSHPRRGLYEGHRGQTGPPRHHAEQRRRPLTARGTRASDARGWGRRYRERLALQFANGFNGNRQGCC
jgi:hypothetical protein